MARDLGIMVSKNGAGAGAAALTTSYTAGTTFNVGNCENLAIWIVSTGASPATNVTALVWKLQTSYDGTNWVDSYTILASSAVTAIEHSPAVVASASAYNWMQTTNGRLSLYARLMVKATAGGALVAGDTAAAYVVAG